MDKRVIFAVAGSGKTTYIVNELSLEKRSLILTYTDGNYDNISRKILAKFGGRWPNSVTLMTYFSFLYNFCYKPYFADIIHAKGIVFDNNPNIKIPQDSMRYYLSPSGLLYSNRLATVYKGNIIKNLIMDCQSYTKYRPNETTGGIFVSWRRKEELPTGA